MEPSTSAGCVRQTREKWRNRHSANAMEFYSHQSIGIREGCLRVV
jgi:hypothetical protein